MLDPRRVQFYDTDETAELTRNASVAAQVTTDGPAQENNDGASLGRQNTTPARPSIAPTNANGLPPAPAENQPLIAALQKIATEQDEDAQIIADLTCQGKEPPNSYGDFLEWTTQQPKATIFCGMGDSPFVEQVHSKFNYTAPG